MSREFQTLGEKLAFLIRMPNCCTGQAYTGVARDRKEHATHLKLLENSRLLEEHLLEQGTAQCVRKWISEDSMSTGHG